MSNWEKIEREKTEYTKVDRTERGWFSGPWFFDWFGGVFRGIWIKINREKVDWNKVTRE